MLLNDIPITHIFVVIQEWGKLESDSICSSKCKPHNTSYILF